jgi:hypothetical protein
MLKSYQRIRPGLRHFEIFRNNRKIFTVRGCRPDAQPTSWRTTPCRLSATAYSVYSQLPSVPWKLPSIRNLRTRHAVVTRDPPIMDFIVCSGIRYRCIHSKPLISRYHFRSHSIRQISVRVKGIATREGHEICSSLGFNSESCKSVSSGNFSVPSSKENMTETFRWEEEYLTYVVVLLFELMLKQQVSRLNFRSSYPSIQHNSGRIPLHFPLKCFILSLWSPQINNYYISLKSIQHRLKID